MNCVNCTKPMAMIEVQEVEVDYCPACGGIWFDEDELELLLEDIEHAHQFLKSFQKVEDSKEDSKNCPVCKKHMEKTRTPGKDPVLLDICKKGHGLWCDRGELQRVVSQVNGASSGPVFKILQDLFH